MRLKTETNQLTKLLPAQAHNSGPLTCKHRCESHLNALVERNTNSCKPYLLKPQTPGPLTCTHRCVCQLQGLQTPTANSRKPYLPTPKPPGPLTRTHRCVCQLCACGQQEPTHANPTCPRHKHLNCTFQCVLYVNDMRL